MLLSLVLVATTAHATTAPDCPRAFDTSEITDAATLAETAFTKLDAAAFAADRHTMESRLRCTADILSPAADARIERVEALGAFLDGRNAQVPQALAGLFSAEPGHQIATSLLPDGHPIRALITPAMLLLKGDPGVTMPVPTSGWIEVDGEHALVAPTQRAAVLQQIDGQGKVVDTHFRWPSDTDFKWVVPVAASLKPVATAPTAVPVSVAAVPPSHADTQAALTRPAPSPWVHRAPLLGAAVASLATSGVLFAMASHDYAVFDASAVLGPDATDQQRSDYRTQLEGMKAKANPETYASWAAGGVGVAFGVVAAVTW